MARQVGTVLGVASLIAILVHVVPADPLASYRNALVLIIGYFTAAGVVAAALLSGRPVLAPAGPAGPAGPVRTGRPGGQQLAAQRSDTGR